MIRLQNEWLDPALANQDQMFTEENMTIVPVRFGDQRDYPIMIGPGILKETGKLMGQRLKNRAVCLISNPRIHRLYGSVVEQSLRAQKFTLCRILVPEGETTKTLAWAETIIGRMIHARLERSACVVALGGGVVGDLAGFVAATYMRGIEFVQIPTTLLAQVDSAVGGKVAVNHALGKNLIGAFLQPRLVVTDPEVLQTLPKRQFCSGLAEIIKSAAVADESLFVFLEKNLPALLLRQPLALGKAIAASCRIKGRIVEQDEKEHGLRALLNYGHTFGHALEAYHYYKGYLHGEAVAIGMVLASRLAVQLGICSAQTAERQIRLLKQAGLPIDGQGEKPAALIRLMQADKKVKNGENNFILTPQIGHARIVKKIPRFSVLQTLKTVLGKG